MKNFLRILFAGLLIIVGIAIMVILDFPQLSTHIPLQEYKEKNSTPLAFVALCISGTGLVLFLSITYNKERKRIPTLKIKQMKKALSFLLIGTTLAFCSCSHSRKRALKHSNKIDSALIGRAVFIKTVQTNVIVREKNNKTGKYQMNAYVFINKPLQVIKDSLSKHVTDAKDLINSIAVITAKTYNGKKVVCIEATRPYNAQMPDDTLTLNPDDMVTEN